MITTILFDLDGTLLPMDQDVFAGTYLKGLAATAAPYGYEPNGFVKAVMLGTKAMVNNKGNQTNESALKKAKIYHGIHMVHLMSWLHISKLFANMEFSGRRDF